MCNRQQYWCEYLNASHYPLITARFVHAIFVSVHKMTSNVMYVVGVLVGGECNESPFGPSSPFQHLACSGVAGFDSSWLHISVPYVQRLIVRPNCHIHTENRESTEYQRRVQ
jgi:hypothetical protein